MIEFVDPRAEPGMPVETYSLSIDPTQGPISIGILSNGFIDATPFLDRVEVSLREALPQAEFRRYAKVDSSAVVSDEMVDAMTAECQAVVAGYGH